MRKLIVLLVSLILFLGIWGGIEKYSPKSLPIPKSSEKVKIVSEESVVVNVVKKFGPSVVTVSGEAAPQASSPFDFGPFSIFGMPAQDQTPQPQNIGSGFVVDARHWSQSKPRILLFPES